MTTTYIHTHDEAVDVLIPGDGGEPVLVAVREGQVDAIAEESPTAAVVNVLVNSERQAAGVARAV